MKLIKYSDKLDDIMSFAGGWTKLHQSFCVLSHDWVLMENLGIFQKKMFSEWKQRHKLRSWATWIQKFDLPWFLWPEMRIELSISASSANQGDSRSHSWGREDANPLIGFSMKSATVLDGLVFHSTSTNFTRKFNGKILRSDDEGSCHDVHFIEYDEAIKSGFLSH